MYPRELFREIDDHFDHLFDFLVAEKKVVDESLSGLGKEGGSITASQGRMLFLLSKLKGCTNILEIGSLGGYSTASLAKSLPPYGRVVALEINPRHIAIAKANLEKFELDDRVIFIGGDAIKSIKMLQGKNAKFDFLFIDGEKKRYWEYLLECRELLCDGALVVADNLIRDGSILDGRHDESADGVRGFAAQAASADWLCGSVIAHVGVKGLDGMYIGIFDRRDGLKA